MNYFKSNLISCKLKTNQFYDTQEKKLNQNKKEFCW